MPYRTPSPPSPTSSDSNLWAEKNSYLEFRAISASDAAIVAGIGKLFADWAKVTKAKYPLDFHPLIHDLSEVSLGRGSYLRAQGPSRLWIRVLISAARLAGELRVDPELFDRSTADAKRMRVIEKEAAVRWVSSEPLVRKLLNEAFKTGGARLDRVLVERSGLLPEEAMRIVYFRGVAQGETSLYDSFALSQDLYQLLYE